MKVLILGPAHPYRGGIADTNEALCRAMLRQGHDAELVTFKVQYPNFLFPGKTQYTQDPKPDLVIHRWIHSLNPLNWVRSAMRIKKQKPDMVVVRYWLPFMGPALGTINRLLGRKTEVIGLCDNVLPHEKRFGDKLFTRYFVGSCDRFMVMSKTVEAELKSFTKKQIDYLPHPINDNLGEVQDKTSSRTKLKLDADGEYILFFGLVRKYKGLDLLLKAMAHPKIIQKKIKLLVVGEFYDPPEEYHELCAEGGIEDLVHFEDRFITTAEIKDYFSAVDLIAQTYHTASQSGITQVAFNFHAPMLVTKVGGLAEIVRHMELGYAVDKDPAQIAESILDFFENKRFDEFSAAVKEEKKKYSWDHFAQTLTKQVHG